MTLHWPRGLALLGALALVACGAPGEPSTTTTGAQPPVEAHALPARPAVPVLDWAPCGEEFPGIECAVAEVPLDYDHPRGETTFIALARLPASDREHRIGSLFINPGGPGASGIDLLVAWADMLADAVQGRYDIVGFDPRGVARSDPLQCWESFDDFVAWYSPILDFPYWKSQERDYFGAMTMVYPQCRSRHQRILEHMSTAEVARDLDLLRQAVGDRQLNYLGWSYGTFLGQTYASMYPRHVGAFVLDGVVDPIHWTLGLSALRAGPAMDKELGEFFRLCDEAGPEGCALAFPGGAAKHYQAALDRLMQGPFVNPEGFVLHYSMMVVMANFAMYDPGTWPMWAEVIESYIAEMAGGSVGAADANAGLAAAPTRLAAPGTEVEPYFTGYEAQMAVDCSDTEYPRWLPSWSAMSAFLGRQALMGPPSWWWASPCANWPVSPQRHLGPWTAATASPVLVVGNLYDGITAYKNAEAVTQLLPRSRLLTFAGWGHCAFDKSACVRENVGRFLVEGTLPPEGTVCPAGPNPFLPQPALRQGQAPEALPPIVRPPPWMNLHLPQ